MVGAPVIIITEDRDNRSSSEGSECDGSSIGENFKPGGGAGLWGST